jgi:hypothetical protein
MSGKPDDEAGITRSGTHIYIPGPRRNEVCVRRVVVVTGDFKGLSGRLGIVPSWGWLETCDA